MIRASFSKRVYLFALSFLVFSFPAVGRSQVRDFVPMNRQDSIDSNPMIKEIRSHQSNPEMLEKAKIAYLINSIKKSPYTFIRNRSPFPGTKAAMHLTNKYRKASDRIRTAEQFIEMVASRSSVSGEPYMVKVSDREVYQSREVLLAELAYLEEMLKRHGQINEAVTLTSKPEELTPSISD